MSVDKIPGIPPRHSQLRVKCVSKEFRKKTEKVPHLLSGTFLKQNMVKTKEKASKSEDFEASLVEISGIEPLTS
jgi:hypothetical protein